MPAEKITVENINVPGYTSNVDAAKYQDAKQALLKVLPSASPGLTQKEMFEQIIPHLSPELFPQGAKAGWWTKTVQLDLEAKGIITRENSTPLRWHRV